MLVRVARLGPDRVLLGARAGDRATAQWGIERMRLALGVDQDLRPFHERFRFDPLIGRAVRADPGLRVLGRPEPFEALAWAICEQLIESGRAGAIERRLIARLGRRCPQTGLRDAPTAEVMARQAPALLCSFDLSPGRAIALIAAAREIAAGRVDLYDADHERGWRRLRPIRGIGSWTVQSLAIGGQGRLDQLPAGDLAYLKLVGRLTSDDPRSRATEEEVEEFFAPYAPWSGLAGAYALRTSSTSTVSHRASSESAPQGRIAVVAPGQSLSLAAHGERRTSQRPGVEHHLSRAGPGGRARISSSPRCRAPPWRCRVPSPGTGRGRGSPRPRAAGCCGRPAPGARPAPAGPRRAWCRSAGPERRAARPGTRAPNRRRPGPSARDRGARRAACRASSRAARRTDSGAPGAGGPERQHSRCALSGISVNA